VEVESKPSMTQEEMDKLRKEEEEMLDEQRRIEKQKKVKYLIFNSSTAYLNHEYDKLITIRIFL
jgi:hypothetical protein